MSEKQINTDNYSLHNKNTSHSDSAQSKTGEGTPPVRKPKK